MEVPAFPGPGAPRFEVTLTTRWCDEDNHGVLNNAVHLTLMEEARLAWCRELDLMEEGGRFPFVLLQVNARFLSPGRGGARVKVELATTHLGTRSFTQVYRLTDVATGAVLGEAEAVLVAWDDAARASRPMTPAFRAAVEAFDGSRT